MFKLLETVELCCVLTTGYNNKFYLLQALGLAGMYGILTG